MIVEPQPSIGFQISVSFKIHGFPVVSLFGCYPNGTFFKLDASTFFKLCIVF